MKRITLEHQATHHQVTTTILIAGRAEWSRSPESKSQLWSTCRFGRWVLAVSIDLWEPPFDPALHPSYEQVLEPGVN